MRDVSFPYGETRTEDEYGITAITAPKRCKRKPLAQLKAEGWQDMDKPGCSGEWRRVITNTDTVLIQEVYSTRGKVRRIYWTAR